MTNVHPPISDERIDELKQSVSQFVENKDEVEIEFPSTLTSAERKIVHNEAGKYGIGHHSRGSKNNRRLILTKAHSALPSTRHLKGRMNQKNVEDKMINEWVGIHGDKIAKELACFRTIASFSMDENVQDYSFPSFLTPEERGMIHKVANLFPNVIHQTKGRRRKYIRLHKLTTNEMEQYRERLKLYNKLHLERKEEREFDKEEMIEKERISSDQKSAEFTKVVKYWQNMARGVESILRYGTWNIEWMDDFFKSDTEFYTTNKDLTDINSLCSSIGGLILELDPDVLAVK